MPIYEFRCLDCNEVFEVLVMGSAGEERITCPNCHQAHFERVLSSTSHQVRSGGNGVGPKVQNRVCSGGTCSTITLPGPE
jgi:putative FmdB family regulatory protein